MRWLVEGKKSRLYSAPQIEAGGLAQGRLLAFAKQTTSDARRVAFWPVPFGMNDSGILAKIGPRCDRASIKSVITL